MKPGNFRLVYLPKVPEQKGIAAWMNEYSKCLVKL